MEANAKDELSFPSVGSVRAEKIATKFCGITEAKTHNIIQQFCYTCPLIILIYLAKSVNKITVTQTPLPLFNNPHTTPHSNDGKTSGPSFGYC